MDIPAQDNLKNNNDLEAKSQLTAQLRSASWAFGIVAGFSFLLNLLYLASPIYMMQVYDRVLASGQKPTLLFLTLIAVVCFAVLGILDAVRGVILSRIAGWLHGRLNNRVAQSCLQATLAGETVGANPLRDLGTIQSFTASPGVKALLDAPWTPIFVLAAFLLHWTIGLIAVLAIGVLLSIAILNERTTRELVKEGAAEQAKAYRVVEASLRNAEAIRAMGMSNAIIERYRSHQRRAIGRNGLGEELSALSGGVTKMFRLVVQMAVLGAGALLVIDGSLSGGAMIAGSILLGRALAPVEQAIGAWKQFVIARGAYQRLEVLFDQYDIGEEPMHLPQPSGALALEDVSFVPMGSDAPILSGVSLALEPGEALAVLGPSASGKSTLCRLIAGVWPTTSGAVRIDGAQLHQWPADQLGRNIGYVPQSVELFAGTIHENIARLGNGDAELVIKAASMAGVHEMVLRLPDGYNTEIGVGGARLSAGQRQRIALARALYGNPKLLILDEPNSNLDPEGEQALTEAIAAAKKNGTTVILVAHRPAALSSVDHILSLRNGQVDLYGPRDEILKELVARQRKASGLRVVATHEAATNIQSHLRRGAAE